MDGFSVFESIFLTIVLACMLVLGVWQREPVMGRFGSFKASFEIQTALLVSWILVSLLGPFLFVVMGFSTELKITGLMMVLIWGLYLYFYMKGTSLNQTSGLHVIAVNSLLPLFFIAQMMFAIWGLFTVLTNTQF